MKSACATFLFYFSSYALISVNVRLGNFFKNTASMRINAATADSYAIDDVIYDGVSDR